MHIAAEWLDKCGGQSYVEEHEEEAISLHKATHVQREAGSDDHQVHNQRPNCEEQRHRYRPNQEGHFGADASDATDCFHRVKECFRRKDSEELEKTQKWVRPADTLHLLQHSEKLSTCDQLIQTQCGTQQGTVIGATCPVQECQRDV